MKTLCKPVHFIHRIFGTRQLRFLNQEILATQYFGLAITDCPWLKYRDFTPGGAAMDSLALHSLFRILNDVKPKSVLEFGLGQSSKLVHQYATHYEGAKALTVEHDQSWIDYFKGHVGESYPLNIQQLDLQAVSVEGRESLSYKNMAHFLQGGQFDFICIDGPFGFNQKHYARPQILDIVPQNLAQDFCIFMHDSERKGEQNTLALLCKKLEQNGIAFVRHDYKSIKWHTVVCSPSWKFLASL